MSCFLVVTTGRCGSSFVAGVLHKNGIHMGEGFNVAPPTPNGDYEDKRLKHLDAGLLDDAISCTWFMKSLSDHTKLVRHKHWGFKDPRLSYLLGLYLAIVPDPVVVHVKRDQKKSIASCMKWYGWSEDYAKKVMEDRRMTISRLLSACRGHIEIDMTERKTEDDILEIFFEQGYDIKAMGQEAQDALRQDQERQAQGAV